MKNFAAIDFETANQQRTSVCSVGNINERITGDKNLEHMIQKNICTYNEIFL